VLVTTPYEIQVRGHLDLEWAEWFPSFVLTHERDGSTVLRGDVADQPALHGPLARIDQLGLPIYRIQQLAKEDEDE